MKRLGILLGATLFAAVLVAQEEVPTKGAVPGNLKTTRDQASYSIGQNIGRSIKNDGLELNTAALVQGLTDALSGGPAKLTDEQMQAAMATFRRELETQMAAKAKVEGDKNAKEGAAFLAANKAKPNVVTLPSGLQYTVMKAGKGPSPSVNDTVKTHYHGTLINGQVFDSSVERGEPISFPVGGVIKGWTEALQRMKVGDKWKLFIPPDLAYGPDGSGPVIGPNSTLIFEVELLGIESQK